MGVPAPLTALAHQASAQVRNTGIMLGIFAALALVGLTGLGFLLAALHIWLAAVSDPLTSALIIGGTLTVIAAVCGAVAAYRIRQRQRARRHTSMNSAVVASSLSIADSGLRILARSKRPMFWPAVAGFAAAWYFSRENANGKDE